MARQVWIGKGNNGNVFVFTDNTSWDIHPFRVRFEIHTPLTVVTGVAGGGVGGTTVVANPGGSPATALSTVTIGLTDYTVGGGGIRIEENDTVRIASADALDFNSADFQINTVQDPEAGVAIAAALTRDTEVADAFDGVTVTGRDFTFDQIGGGTATATVPLIDIDDYPTRVSTIGVQDSFLVADFDNSNTVRYTTGFDLRVFIQDNLSGDGVVDSVTYAGGNLVLGRSVGADLIATGLTEPFDLHDDVSTGNATPNPLDRLVSSDESADGDPNEWLTIRDLLYEMADSASTRQASPADDDRFFLADVSESGRPLRFIEKDELQTSLVTQQSVAHALFGAMREVDIPEPSGTPRPFAGTGYTDWSGRTLMFISIGNHHETAGSPTEQATFTLFIDELLEVATSTAGSVPIILVGPTRNAMAIHFVDRGTSATVHLALFGRTASGELLMTTDGSSTGGFYPLRAIAQ